MVPQVFWVLSTIQSQKNKSSLWADSTSVSFFCGSVLGRRVRGATTKHDEKPRLVVVGRWLLVDGQILSRSTVP